MPRLDIDTLGAFGVARDEKDYRLDPAVWSDVLNTRCADGAVLSMSGRTQVFGTPLQAPHFVVPVQTPNGAMWVYMSLTDGFAYDGSTHAEITRAAGGDYNATHAMDINSTILGGILIINNGIDLPQFWANSTLATDLANLTNWDTSKRARVIRALGPFLVAAYITETGVIRPHKVLWSHPADPGSVPSSWDPSDPSKDSGETELPDVDSGVILDMKALRGQLFIYKGNSTWRMRYIGGQSIFAFDPFLETSGLLAPRCVGLIGDGQRHFVVTQDNVIAHDGNTSIPLFDKRFRKYLFNQLDVANYTKSFVFTNFENKEMWFCYPTRGSTECNMAVLWNWIENTINECEVDFRAASTGEVSTSDTETWDSDSQAWDSDLTPWSISSRRKVVVAKPSNTKLLQLDSGALFDGVIPTCRVQRTGLAIVGRKRDKSAIVDFNSRKLITKVWPRVEGGPVNIRIGSADTVDGPIRWTSPIVFNPATEKFACLITEGCSNAIEFSTAAEVAWKLEGYKLDLTVIADEP